MVHLGTVEIMEIEGRGKDLIWQLEDTSADEIRTSH